MESSNIFILIIVIIVFGQTFSFLLDYLNIKHRNKPIPKELEDVYNQEEYQKQQAYEYESSLFSFINSLFSFGTLLLILFLDGFAYLDNLLRVYLDSEIWISLSFLGLLFFLSTLISLPFSWYSTFVIEEKYGFNKTTHKIFFLDTLKSILITIIIGGGLIYLIILLYHWWDKDFWIFTWALVTFFSVFTIMFYSQLIVPLFNKQTPLEAGSLREKIDSFAQKAGFQLKNVYVIDGSKRSTKANAYFTGLGAKKRIVLYDTLIKNLSENEIVAVLAHEIGHYKHQHILKGLITSIAQTGVVLYVFSLLIGSPILSKALGSPYTSFHLGLLVFSFLFEPISLLTRILSHIFSRKNEYEADDYAKQFGLGKALISGLKKLSRNSLSNLTPHPFYVFVYYSHPSLYQRIKAIKTEN